MAGRGNSTIGSYMVIWALLYPVDAPALPAQCKKLRAMLHKGDALGGTLRRGPRGHSAPPSAAPIPALARHIMCKITHEALLYGILVRMSVHKG